MVKITLLFPERFTETWRIRTKIIIVSSSNSNDNDTSMINFDYISLT